MVLAILAISLIVFIVGVILEIILGDGGGDDFAIVYAPGATVFIIVGIVGLVLLGNVINARYINEKIEMYEEENAVIEEQIADVVNDYMEYEQGVFEDISPDEAMTVVVLYPELKSSALVEKQIETYTANNQKIKELKEDYISAKSFKWWLYFGG